jgi:hypothetical protein
LSKSDAAAPRFLHIDDESRALSDAQVIVRLFAGYKRLLPGAQQKYITRDEHCSMSAQQKYITRDEHLLRGVQQKYITLCSNLKTKVWHIKLEPRPVAEKSFSWRRRRRSNSKKKTKKKIALDPSDGGLCVFEV